MSGFVFPLVVVAVVAVVAEVGKTATTARRKKGQRRYISKLDGE